MAADARRIAWDACVWIAMIQRERPTLRNGQVENRDAMCREVLALAQGGSVEIVTSALCLAEVCRDRPAGADEPDLLFDFYRHSWVLMVAMDTGVGRLARTLMMGDYPGLKPPDAIHIATAIYAQATELQTFDDGLLALDGVIPCPDGGTLLIRKPTSGSRQIGLGI